MQFRHLLDDRSCLRTQARENRRGAAEMWLKLDDSISYLIGNSTRSIDNLIIAMHGMHSRTYLDLTMYSGHIIKY